MLILYRSIIILNLVWAGHAVLLDTSRTVTKVLTVNNGGRWGTWGQVHYCDTGTYATGYQMKIEAYQHHGDDTELNAILLRCEALNTTRFGGEIGSRQAPWGSWTGVTSCGHKHGVKYFLTGFALQVEPDQGGDDDDTTANYVKFKCRDFQSGYGPFEMSRPPGHGQFGGYGSWSQECGPNSAICGIQTLVEVPQGPDTDDTALNNVKMFCCSTS